jgi:mono/diheme cytochrome c family protein
MKHRILATTCAVALGTGILALALSLDAAEPGATRAAPGKAGELSVERGRYIAKVAGCNDCHTPGYAMTGGTVPEKDWLVGDAVGWKGPWGTTYPANLRRALAKMSEDEWVKAARNAQMRPPMPWFALRDMSEADLRALHRFVRSLGAAGSPAPAYLPPGVEPQGPVVTFPAPPEPAEKSASR